MEARKVLQLAKKWFWLIALACIIGGIAGLAVSILQPKMYESDTTLFVGSQNRTDYNSVVGDQQSAKAFASIPQSASVLAAALKAAGDRSLSLSQLPSMVTVANNLDTQYVIIQVRDRDPKRAARLATEIAKQAISQFEAATTDGSTKQFVKQELDRIESEIKDLENQLAKAQSQVTNTSSSPQTVLIDQLKTNLSTDRTLYNQQLNLYIGVSGTQVTVVQDPEVPQNPVGQGKTLAIAMGMLVGLVTIVGVIILIEQNDDVLRTPDKVSRATGLSTFISVAYLPAIAKQNYQLNSHYEVTENDDEVTGETDTVKLEPAIAKQARLLALHLELTEQEAIGVAEMREVKDDTGNHQLVIAKQASLNGLGNKKKDNVSNEYHVPEEFLTLGVLLSSESGQLTSNGDSIRSLLITSPENGDGKTLIASQIALGLARVGVQVVLVDANLRKPGVHTIFGLSNRVGLSSMLTSSEKVEPNFLFDALQNTHEPNLAIMPSGPIVDSPSELLSSSRMTAILNVLSEKAFIVVDSPATLTSSESVILAKKCDGILMVVDARHTAATKLNRSLEILTRVNMSILGVVLNRARN